MGDQKPRQDDTSDEVNSLQTRTPFNPGNAPIVDCNGRPFTPGCRVKFVLPSYYINTFSDTGALISNFDPYGGVTIRADHEHNYHDERGNIAGRRHEVYATSRYHSDGAFEGHRVTLAGLGDPHEHGVTQTYVEVIDD
ncbi:hypothetical protein [Microvirga sp. VF16]|uniref:hypothetical protein n=1 Tax=Microvirga sp. VF16 TaxID=2807101 RepID=UPI00193E945E|nr:hypothetical protein [Microvirga sp. VF16]QRM34905.1 hypothetical protein JO965_42355 [Microvirga sp. VF16]